MAAAVCVLVLFFSGDSSSGTSFPLFGGREYWERQNIAATGAEFGGFTEEKESHVAISTSGALLSVTGDL